MGKAVFITGTGTEVGKSALSLAFLIWARQQGLRTAYYKPIQCGTFPFGNPPQPCGDQDWISVLIGDTQISHVTYKLRMAASPHLAAEQEGITIDLGLIRRDLESLCNTCDLVVMEGVGGAAVPVNRKGTSLASLATDMSLPHLIVCSPGLGTLHHTLTTWAYLKSLEARMTGFVFSHLSSELPATCADNRTTLQALLDLPCFGELPFCPELGQGGKAFQPKAAAWLAPIAPSLEAWWNRERK